MSNQDASVVPRPHSDALWLALDQGGHASRALVFAENGEVVAQAFAAIETCRDGDRVEHTPGEIVASLNSVIADVVANLGSKVSLIRAAGLATQRSSVVCWDIESGRSLSPVLSWQDLRNRTLVERLRPNLDEIQRETGLVLSPHYGASKLRWCLENLPQVQHAAHRQSLRAGPLSSYLLYALLSERPCVVDPANASRTQLWSPKSRSWSSSLLNLFSIPERILPACVSTRFQYGHLPVGGRHVPLTVCTGDQSAVPFAMGGLEEGVVTINMGTGAFMMALLNADMQVAPLLRSVLFSSDQTTTYAIEGTVNGAGSALQWFAEHSAMDVEMSLRNIPYPSPTVLPVFINTIGGVGSPHWITTIPPTFIDEGSANDEARLIAVVESIAFLIADNIHEMTQRISTLCAVVVGGGLSNCSYLCQCIADLCGLVVNQTQESELTAKGLAWLVAEPERPWVTSPQTRYVPLSNASLWARYRRWQKYLGER